MVSGAAGGHTKVKYPSCHRSRSVIMWDPAQTNRGRGQETAGSEPASETGKLGVSDTKCSAAAWVGVLRFNGSLVNVE